MSVLAILREQVRSRHLIWTLAKSDFKTRYIGSYFGLVWEILQPLSLIFIFWFIFDVILGTNTIEGIPFLPWFIVGLIPWFFFSDAWTNATNAFIQYSYLVKKMVFQTRCISRIPSNLYYSFLTQNIMEIELYAISHRMSVRSFYFRT